MELLDTNSAPADTGVIMDGDQTTFIKDVIEASRRMPVLVDFWASWCGPCKTLTPTLEKIVRAAGGKVRLVKIDVDRNRALVEQLAGLGLPMQSIPTVAAFWQGQIADLFQGALPESEIRRFIEALMKLAGTVAPAADLITEARTALDSGDFEQAAGLFEAALEEDSEKPEAWAGLARSFLGLGDEEAAEHALGRVPAKLADHAEIAGARSALALAREGHAAIGARQALEQRLQADPNDHEARYELATALNAAGEREAAAEALLTILRKQRGWNDDAARLQLLKLFESWGLEDPATIAARRKLSTLLFS
ncbi:MAG TPA: tetratricopeptide repeat protein [Acidiphilium sp.]|nr:MAG: co-chaperone YbbN [Acidiphilium sp. 21-60-14]OYV89814.1 MAG: co-chaperone YbbN [Acidiphilium sp. 37-60-79]OZB39512.1 MAG: co-chaperone YbbN [Acidiphilium sp. 34-60-192]HQT88187.1 tetratricopeptide repeat protein [Acidiphilium sp.]HQU24757.1 tetratricopeptide repeat protein [Acidiphilium sp.]